MDDDTKELDRQLAEWLSPFNRALDPIDLDRQAFSEMSYDLYRHFQNWMDAYTVGEILAAIQSEDTLQQPQMVEQEDTPG